MGLYTYNCQNCGTINIELKMNQIPLDKCPQCGCENIERVWDSSSGNFNFHCDGSYSKPNIKD